MIVIIAVVVIGALGAYFGLIITSSHESTTCVIPVEGNLILTVQNSSNGKPLSSVPVQVSYVPPPCKPNPYTTSTFTPMTTNGSGIITVCCGVGTYYFTIALSGVNYSVNASIGPVRATCVTVAIPSGKINVTYLQSYQTVC